MAIETGTRLGQYEVQDLIGEGAMGVVYRAYHVQLARAGAVKFMHAITPDKDSIARFRREAQAIAQMRHPNILNVFDFGEYEGTPYMIVEYVPGGSLASQMRQEPLDRASALRYLRGIAAGLDYAHSLGIVHRDVKPANVLLEKDGTPVIADFGLVKMLQGSSIRSMTGVTTGTPAYMAPEQVTGSQVGPAADRYSLATIAYEMLTGAIPFEGEGLMEVLYAQVHRNPPPPSARVPELGPQVDAVIMRALDKDPQARWETCDAFVSALGQALASPGPPAVERTVVMAAPGKPKTTTRTVDSEGPRTVAVAAAPAVATQPRSDRRRNAIVAAIVIPLLVLLALVGYTITRPPSLSLSSSTVRPGDSIVVTAAHLPANQSGEIQLLSPLQTFPFRSNGFGGVSTRITVPADTETGAHTIRICWNGRCHAQATLVVTSVAGASPSPASSSSPNPSPGSSASPTSRPSPTPGATPTSAQAPAISLSPSSGKAGSQVNVLGTHFKPGRTVTIYFVQPPTAPSTPLGTVVTGSNGNFLRTVTIPLTALPGLAQIRACDSSGACTSRSFTVTVT